MPEQVRHDGWHPGTGASFDDATGTMILVACGLLREARLLGGAGIVAVPGGGDAARLEAALDAAAGGARLIVSAGIAGALDPALKAGDIVLHVEPLPFRGGDGGGAAPAGAAPVATPHPCPSPEGEGLSRALAAALPEARHGAIIGQDRIAATAAEKAALYAATGALAVDMESHIAARVAARHGLAFAAIRAISDTAAHTLPPAALVGMKPDGSMALGRVLASLARRPAQLPALIATGRSAEAAFGALGRVHHALVGVGVRLADLG
ncbi:phosphorylase [Sphingomonas sp.]|uniref:phosphorylase family protein n=1 Tax=Sphingomonas sp. TaxID=28214 RepID=UPI001D20F700|nr:phosphorylase [Sphingomonas sp.]MBX9795745.1 phosphorylase [Sphingomonas sp.]